MEPTQTATPAFNERYLRLFGQLATLMREEAPEAVAEQACAMIAQVLAVEACSLLLQAGDSADGAPQLRMSAATHIPREEWAKIRIASGAGPVGTVFNEGKPLLIRGEQGFRERLGRGHDARYATPSCLIVPVFVAAAVEGVINVANPVSGEPFDERDLAMLQAVAGLVGGAVDRARRQRHSALLHARLQMVFDNLLVGVATVDGAERVADHNARLPAMLGLGVADLRHKKLKDALPGMLYNVVSRMIGACKKQHAPTHERVHLEHEGNELRLGITVQEIDAAEGGAPKLLLMCQDITREEELLRLRQAEEAKQCFLGMISHELRTPLTVIKGALPLIEPFERSNIPEAAMIQVHKVISRNTHRLIDVVNSMLMVTEIENGTLSVSKRMIDLAHILRKSAGQFEEMAQGKGVVLTLRIAPDIGPMIGDESRLGHVTRELIHNAVKFSPRGAPVTVDAVRDKEQVVIEVKNQGEPIPAAARDALFERFYQVDNTRTRAAGGCGLGLFLTYNIVRLHGGELRHLDGEEGQTVFQVRLPYTQGE